MTGKYPGEGYFAITVGIYLTQMLHDMRDKGDITILPPDGTIANAARKAARELAHAYAKEALRRESAGNGR